MRAPGEPFGDPSSSREEIFRATYLALADHGYADLSIQQIADRADLSKSTIYHHFDGKDDLLMAFADRLLEWYIEEMVYQPDEDPLAMLEDALDLFLLGETEGGLTVDEFWPTDLNCIYLELRTRAARDPEVREYFDSTDRMIRDSFAALVQEGIENGTFRDVDPQRVAAVLFVVMEGAMILSASEADSEWLHHVRAFMDEYLDGLTR